MKTLIISGILMGFLALGPVAVFAEDAKETSHDRVQIIEDEKSGVVRIVIDKKEVVLIDAKGIHVNGDIDFTGSITDIGNTKKEGG